MKRAEISLTPILLAISCLSLLIIPVHSWATCSGSGLTWQCTAGSTSAQINSAISSASNGATITLANGSYAINNIVLDPRNGVTVQCESVRGCTITTSGNHFLITTGSSTHVTNLMRVSGFVFSSSSAGYNFSIGPVNGDPWVDKLRIDHCTFNNTTGIPIGTGHMASTKMVNGVIDHNIFQGARHNYVMEIFGGGDGDWNVGSLQGTGQNLFIEDNVLNYGTDDLSDGVGMDSWHGGRVVFRHNTVTNARLSTHGVCHDGPANLEVYDNVFSDTAGGGGGYRIIHHQGSGEIMIFNNAVNPTSSSIVVQHYRSTSPNPEGCGTCDGNQTEDGNRSPTGTYRGYPCYRQPGRTGSAEMRPMYFWNNRFGSTGNEAYVSIEGGGAPGYILNHVAANRDYYEAVSKNVQTSQTSPFNGTTGMGFGPLANRPTSCTTGPEALDAGKGGVGYFATDSGTQGTLYMCSATNTWTAHYKPYTYPHPLTGGGDLAPPPPQGFQISK